MSLTYYYGNKTINFSMWKYAYESLGGKFTKDDVRDRLRPILDRNGIPQSFLNGFTKAVLCTHKRKGHIKYNHKIAKWVKL